MKNNDEIIKNVQCALTEDVGAGDVTSDLIDSHSLAEAKLISRDNAILCGVDWFNEVFNQLDNSIETEWQANDGDKIKQNQILCTLNGPIRPILTGERTAINFIQTLSAVSSNVATFVSRVKNTNVKILDTRKTIPGLRYAQKYAVTTGGGTNHRKGLYDEVLIKENHILACGSIEKTIEKAKEENLPITIEVENLEQLERALKTDVNRIMLDNFSPPNIYKAVNLTEGKAELEVSGNIDINNVGTIAGTGVDYISIGALTKNIKAVDFSLLIELVYVSR